MASPIFSAMSIQELGLILGVIGAINMLAILGVGIFAIIRSGGLARVLVIVSLALSLFMFLFALVAGRLLPGMAFSIVSSIGSMIAGILPLIAVGVGRAGANQNPPGGYGPQWQGQHQTPPPGFGPAQQGGPRYYGS